MADVYSENLSYWANSEARRQSNRKGSKASDNREHTRSSDVGLGRIEPVRLTFDSPDTTQKSSTDQYAATNQDVCNTSPKVNGEAPAEGPPADSTPTASMVDGAQTPDPPEQLTGQQGPPLQVPEDQAPPQGGNGAAPDVVGSQLADVALVWRECQNGRAGRRRARTSVTSLYSSGAMEALVEDIKGQRAAADLQLAAARREQAAADELASKAGYQGFCIQGQLLDNLESAVDRAAAAQSGKEQ